MNVVLFMMNFWVADLLLTAAAINHRRWWRRAFCAEYYLSATVGPQFETQVWVTTLTGVLPALVVEMDVLQAAQVWEATIVVGDPAATWTCAPLADVFGTVVRMSLQLAEPIGAGAL
jgi:hypothetical protein